MKPKILLFLVSCVVNIHCMDEQSSTKKIARILANMSEEESSSKQIPIKNKKKPLFYTHSIKCPKKDCNRKVSRKERGALTRALLVHLYSKRHKPQLWEKCWKYIEQNAYQKNNALYIKSSNQNKKLKAPDRSDLVASLISSRYATRQNNPTEFEKIQKYVERNMKIISS